MSHFHQSAMRLGLLLLAITIPLGVGCGPKDNDGAAEEVGEEIDEAAEDIEDAVEDIGD